ncbi:MAG: hypothetical protein AAF468_06785 [Pseudomonadota bacterium]
MMEPEARWIGQEIIKLCEAHPESVLLNVGSSTAEFRKTSQPVLNLEIFDPLQKLGVDVIHNDLKEDEGVDFVGDICEAELLNLLKSKNINIVLCSNLLEHVEQPQNICSAMQQICQKPGYVVASVPFRFPYHNDPIDTMFRPTPEQIQALFPGSQMMASRIVEVESSYFSMLKRNRRERFRLLIRIFTPFYKFHNWKKIVSYLPKMFQKIAVSCAVLKIE